MEGFLATALVWAQHRWALPCEKCRSQPVGGSSVRQITCYNNSTCPACIHLSIISHLPYSYSRRGNETVADSIDAARSRLPWGDSGGMCMHVHGWQKAQTQGASRVKGQQPAVCPAARTVALWMQSWRSASAWCCPSARRAGRRGASPHLQGGEPPRGQPGREGSQEGAGQGGRCHSSSSSSSRTRRPQARPWPRPWQAGAGRGSTRQENFAFCPFLCRHSLAASLLLTPVDWACFQGLAFPSFALQ